VEDVGRLRGRRGCGVVMERFLSSQGSWRGHRGRGEVSFLNCSNFCFKCMCLKF
jgi:hypothetical protein